MCSERMQRKPLQYIINEWDFRELTLHMRPPIFIPRPETEQLVDLVLESLRSLPDVCRGHKCAKMLEVGCGSGAITLSVLQECSQVECTAVDVNEEACNLTLVNADLCALPMSRLHVLRCPLTHQGRLDHPALENSTFDLVVSNPPYLNEEEVKNLQPELWFEDKRALSGGEDGLDVVQSVLRLCQSSVLVPGGALLMEVGLAHPSMLQRMFEGEHQFQTLYFHRAYRDFTDRDRFVEIRKKL